MKRVRERHHVPAPSLLRSGAILAVALAGLFLLAAFTWPWNRDGPWRSDSRHPVVALTHPDVETVFASRPGTGTSSPYRFVAFGDQRALADGEWQEMIAAVAKLDRDEGGIAFLVDTGDIVYDGKHSDQFRMLAEILKPVERLPYLVAIGNHEVDSNKTPLARTNTAAFLASSVPELKPDRLYYRRDLGGVTFLFLDSNDLVYGPDGDRDCCPAEIERRSPEGAQVLWIQEQLASLGDDRDDDLRVVAMHHPPVQSSKKDRDTARSLWNMQFGGERLLDILADGGADVLLVGHTHTYERFRLTRDDGREIDVVNVSGRPRESVLWIGAGSRRARDLRGHERESLEEEGWTGLDRWNVVQEDRMPRDAEADQFAVFTVEPGGRLFLEVRFLDEEAPGGTRRGERVRLH